jgi:hypothetical protein
MPVLGSLGPGTSVAIEAANGWGWLAELLDELGAKPMWPIRWGARQSRRLKNDRPRNGLPLTHEPTSHYNHRLPRKKAI